MSQALTRRSLVSAAPAAIAAASMQPCATTDAELLALRPLWLTTLANFKAALDIKNATEAQIFARCELYPDHQTFTGSWDEYFAACARITADRDAVAAEVGDDEADQREEATSNANVAIVDRITEISASTLAGLLFKVEVSADWRHKRAELTQSIMDDIVALAKGALNA